MDLGQFKQDLESYMSDWKSEISPDCIIEEFVTKALINVNPSEYKLAELLDEKLIRMLLKKGESHLNSRLRGSSLSQIRNSQLVSLKYMQPIYEKLFEHWSKRGWIECIFDKEKKTIEIKRL